MNARDRQVKELRAQALELKTRGYAALDAGDGPLAQELLDRSILRTEIADALEAGEGAALQKPRAGANVQVMTSEQLERRGRARAKTLAKGDKRKEAIAARWGSLRKAAEAAGISPASLSGYLDGTFPCPKAVAEVFAVDPALPATKATWKKGVVD